MKRKALEAYTHARNYGCRIREYIYHSMKVVQLENEFLKVSVLADKGADIYEFIYKPMDMDFMWHSFNGVKRAPSVHTREQGGGPFLDYYEGGWQELFPNISDDCVYMGAPLGVHGEAALPAWDYRINQDEVGGISVLFSLRTARSPYLLQRTMSLKGDDPTLYIDESVTNEGAEPLEFMWGHHPAFGPAFLDDSCEIRIAGDDLLISHMTYNGRPVEGAGALWPNARIDSETELDLSKVAPPEAKYVLQYAVGNMKESRYELVNHNYGVGFELAWDKEIFPFLWVWALYGGAPYYPWYGRAYTLALEPWSAVPGNLAKVIEAGNGIRIQPGETIRTWVRAAANDHSGRVTPKVN